MGRRRSKSVCVVRSRSLSAASSRPPPAGGRLTTIVEPSGDHASARRGNPGASSTTSGSARCFEVLDRDPSAVSGMPPCGRPGSRQPGVCRGRRRRRQRAGVEGERPEKWSPVPIDTASRRRRARGAAQAGSVVEARRRRSGRRSGSPTRAGSRCLGPGRYTRSPRSETPRRGALNWPEATPSSTTTGSAVIASRSEIEGRRKDLVAAREEQVSGRRQASRARAADDHPTLRRSRRDDDDGGAVGIVGDPRDREERSAAAWQNLGPEEPRLAARPRSQAPLRTGRRPREACSRPDIGRGEDTSAFALHASPRRFPVSWSRAHASASPPSSAVRQILPPAEKATHRLSGEKTGKVGDAGPRTMVVVASARRCTNNWFDCAGAPGSERNGAPVRRDGESRATSGRRRREDGGQLHGDAAHRPVLRRRRRTRRIPACGNGAVQRPAERSVEPPGRPWPRGQAPGLHSGEGVVASAMSRSRPCGPLEAMPEQLTSRGPAPMAAPRPVRVVLQHRGQRVRHRLTRECARARQHLVQDAPERPDVRALVDRCPRTCSGAM